MPLISVQNACVSFGMHPLLDGVDFALEPGERVCVTGRNGAGKSTFLALLSGQLTPDSGTVVRPGPAFGQMPQDVPDSWSGSVFGVVASVFGKEGEAMIAAHAHSSANLTMEQALVGGSETDTAGLWERYGEIMGVINNLELDADADFLSLSGGTKRRVALARALLCSNDLILDEPTNHLDITTILWLEDFLIRKSRSLVFVSHDREFSKKLATRIVELDRGKLYSYDCGYDKFLERREERLETEESHFAEFDKKLAREEAWIRQGVKARRTRNMGRVRALRALRVERANRREKVGSVRMMAQEAEKSGKLVLEAENVAFAYPESTPLFTGFSTVIQRGDKIGLIGANGAGKSTLLRVLLGELKPTEGTIRQGTQLHVSYFDQLRETLDPETIVMDAVAEGNDVVTVGGNTRHVAGYLQDFLFTPDRLRLPVKVLSGGERNRLLLAKLFTRPSNLLVLDEPTNDLDVETLELLEDLLAEYSGTVILVSHDRRFLDNLVTSTLALEGDGKVHEYIGAYTDWLRQRTNEEKKSIKSAEGKNIREEKTKPKKLSFNEQRELSQLKESLEQLPEKMNALGQERQEVETKMADPEFFTRDQQGFSRCAERLTAIEEEELEMLAAWEEMEARVKELESVGQ